MTNEERNLIVDELVEDLVAELTTRGLVQDEVSGWRLLITKGLFALPEHLCTEHLRQDLQRYHNWLGKDLEQLSPN